MSKPKSKTKKESLQINKDSSLPVNNLKMEELSLITTFKKNPLSTPQTQRWYVNLCQNFNR